MCKNKFASLHWPIAPPGRAGLDVSTLRRPEPGYSPNGAAGKQVPVFLWQATVSARNVRQCAIADRVASHKLFIGRTTAGDGAGSKCTVWGSGPQRRAAARRHGWKNRRILPRGLKMRVLETLEGRLTYLTRRISARLCQACETS